jgi:hypothetical protein
MMTVAGKYVIDVEVEELKEEVRQLKLDNDNLCDVISIMSSKSEFYINRCNELSQEVEELQKELFAYRNNGKNQESVAISYMKEKGASFWNNNKFTLYSELRARTYWPLKKVQEWVKNYMTFNEVKDILDESPIIEAFDRIIVK